jgi:hypothetical protein
MRCGLVLLENHLERGTHLRHPGIVQTGFAIGGSEACGEQQEIPLAQWHFEHVRQRQNHLPAGRGAAGFEKADVACGYFRLQRQLELAQMARLPPSAKQRPDTNGFY